jgi:hypothetical protein
LTLKKDRILDIDVVNMSLGGPTVWDGRDAFDRFLGELTKAEILTVCSAGNEGPIPNSVGSPATSFAAISVGALDFAPSSRVLYEYLGLVFGPDGEPFNGDEGAGMGLVMRPDDRVRVANFSSRGPLSDGRTGPEIVALGHWTFFVGPHDDLTWAGGTSFAAPAVAGAAALLNAYWEDRGRDTAPTILENALLTGANPDVVGPAWHGADDQGNGVLDVPASLARLKRRHLSRSSHLRLDKGDLDADALGKPVKGKTQTWQSGRVAVDPSESYDAVFEISPWTSKITIELYDIETPNNSDAAYWPNALEIHVQNAKRSASPHPVALYWYPFFFGDALTIEIEDGPWTVFGIPWEYIPMEPGLMKLSLIGDYSNESPVRFKVRLTRENDRPARRHSIASGRLGIGDDALIPVEIPAGVKQATFDLSFDRDWTRFPTSDMDMLIVNPNFEIESDAGATLNAPERAVVQNPAPGTWHVLINAFEVYKPDSYELFLTTE